MPKYSDEAGLALHANLKWAGGWIWIRHNSWPCALRRDLCLAGHCLAQLKEKNETLKARSQNVEKWRQFAILIFWQGPWSGAIFNDAAGQIWHRGLDCDIIISLKKKCQPHYLINYSIHVWRINVAQQDPPNRNQFCDNKSKVNWMPHPMTAWPFRWAYKACCIF